MDLEADEREHVTLRLKRDEKIRKEVIELAKSSDIRLTVDTVLDYAQASLLFSKLNGKVRLIDILRLKKSFPWLLKLNDDVAQKSVDF